jgi:hypothetical protein
MLGKDGQEMEGTQWAINPQLYDPEAIRNRATGHVMSLAESLQRGPSAFSIAPQRTYGDISDAVNNPSPYIKKDSKMYQALKAGFQMGAESQAQVQGQAAAQGAEQGVPLSVTGPRVPISPEMALHLRSTTRSPGIGINGKPIAYVRR